ncbi:RagB/SusD family nutrient uptake outer membrane protein [Filimonas effusa]|uniref:RagB/SusD family nutrient uptake outer membrane protein n=1 Tax=Filimonas effusa TaxID=2508721 RepID=A0A4Q1DDZ2_9BACT|nr:RagB/SusD family nutrient uptake outer membrane protein [Filimonas effusa]RXK86903.1 RagB/SusD family nutrient uptake outer membrane protein [Filimonas effusa]
MSTNWKQYIPRVLAVAIASAALLSCKKWIDVTPQTQVRDDLFFSKQSGFVNAINGVYLAMGDPSMYGREMTFGVVDVIGQMYTLRSTFGAQVYIDAQNYLYSQANVQALTDPIWQNTYNAIANLNSVIENFDKADTAIFSPGNYALLKGEAYALRAFLHFDLARLYAPSYLSAKNAPAIPYVTEFRPKVVPKSSVEVVMQKVLADLLKADTLLVNDPIGSSVVTAATLTDRKQKMNRYAVKATLARVYLWMGDKANALKYAEQVITASTKTFPWITRGAVATSTEESRDRIFSTELIFNLQVTNTAANIKSAAFQLDTTAASIGGGRSTSIAIVDYTRIYDQYETNATNGGVGGNDLRWLYLVRKYTTSTTAVNASFYGKLYQYTSMPSDAARRQPILRVSEMYYIAAECLAETNLPAAINYVNQVRINRNLASFGNAITKEQLDNEIYKEYRKEFPAEGQMFFYYKRLDKSAVPGAVQPFNKQNYIVPLPVKELEFGA